jgi:hypothetical protein
MLSLAVRLEYCVQMILDGESGFFENEIEPNPPIANYDNTPGPSSTVLRIKLWRESKPAA